MKTVASISEIVGLLHDRKSGVDLQVCASVESRHSENGSGLTAHLDAFLRPVDQLHAERHLRPSWLPLPEVVKEHCDIGEASEMTREIFHHWVARVRRSIPDSASVSTSTP